MATLELQNVTKFFGKVVAVENLSLSVEDGEFVTLLGPSGCGKSTTLNLIAGLEELTSGNIFLDGENINDFPPNERDMAMVFQDYALYPHMTVFHNMAFSLKLKKVPMAVQKDTVARTAKLLDLGELLGRYPRELSGGQRQRVAVGRAIVRDPKLFLLDEPLSNLDERLRVRMRAELKELFMQLGATTIYVTHDQEEAMSMSDRIAVVNQGRLQQFGTPGGIFNEPDSIFVAKFVGSPPINLLQGTLTREGDSLVFCSGELRIVLPAALEARLHRRDIIGGQEIILGIRPEHLKLNGAAPVVNVPARVHLLEPLGYFTVVTLELINRCELKCIVTTDEQMPRRGDQVQVGIIPDKVLIFDAETEERLTV